MPAYAHRGFRIHWKKRWVLLATWCYMICEYVCCIKIHKDHAWLEIRFLSLASHLVSAACAGNSFRTKRRASRCGCESMCERSKQQRPGLLSTDSYTKLHLLKCHWCQADKQEMKLCVLEATQLILDSTYFSGIKLARLCCQCYQFCHIVCLFKICVRKQLRELIALRLAQEKDVTLQALGPCKWSWCFEPRHMRHPSPSAVLASEMETCFALEFGRSSMMLREDVVMLTSFCGIHRNKMILCTVQKKVWTTE